jgi:hypothetical protein
MSAEIRARGALRHQLVGAVWGLAVIGLGLAFGLAALSLGLGP